LSQHILLLVDAHPYVQKCVGGIHDTPLWGKHGWLKAKKCLLVCQSICLAQFLEGIWSARGYRENPTQVALA
jgi:hypothetical protein